MGGANPYIQKPDVGLPVKPYKVTFVNRGVRSRSIPRSFPMATKVFRARSSTSRSARASISTMPAAASSPAPPATSIVKKGLETCNESTEDEEDQLDNAPALTPQSRLGCQCVPDGTSDVEIEIPEWNRNAVREEH